MVDFTVVVLPAAYASSVAGTLDLLGAAALLAPRLGVKPPRWRVCSPGGGAVVLGNGMRVETQALPRRTGRDGSTWIVPGLGTSGPRDLETALATAPFLLAAEAIRRHVQSNGVVAGSCAGVFLLQAAGVLKDRSATTSWWLGPQLARVEPTCRVDAGRMVVDDGAVITAGAAFAHIDLVLHLLRRRYGPPLADAVSRTLLVDGRSAQAPYVLPAMLARGDALMARLHARIEDALPDVPSIAQLAQECCMSARTLARHVRAVTGQSPLALVQSIRLNKARVLLDAEGLSVEEVAFRLGYADGSALRRLVRRMSGATPRQWRRPAVAARAARAAPQG
jgi:transcriptional regulator GlxA family with amidase domain